MIFNFFQKQYDSVFINYELSPGIYTNKDISDVVYTMGDHGGTLQIEYDDISMKTKIVLTRFGGISGTLRFDGQSFLRNLLGFTPCWIMSQLMHFMLIDQVFILVIKI